MRIAVDQRRTGAASALPATELGSHIADQVTQCRQQIDATIDEDGDVAVVMTKLQGGFGHRFFLQLSSILAGKKATQLAPDNLARRQGPGGEIVGWRSPFRRAGAAAAML